MSLPTSLNHSPSKLPFFCSSSSLIFYLDDSSTFSQSLTLYNPYQFSICYKVLSTAPRKYFIAEPQGEIHGLHSVDTVIRLLDTSSSSGNVNAVHRLRIQYFDRRQPEDLVGKRDITCTVLSNKPYELNSDEDFKNLSDVSSRGKSRKVQPGTKDPLFTLILLILALICTFVLILPSKPDQDDSLQSRIPSSFHMTSNSKVIASYILGLLTVVFLRR